MLKTISIIITGKVQGVFFRQNAQEKARSLGIKGEVKNMPDDSVHISATGTAEQLDKLIDWCRQGPARAKVEKVSISDIPLQSFSGFNIVR